MVIQGGSTVTPKPDELIYSIQKLGVLHVWSTMFLRVGPKKYAIKMINVIKTIVTTANLLVCIETTYLDISLSKDMINPLTLSLPQVNLTKPRNS